MGWFRYFVIYVLFLSLWMCARSETLDRGDYAVMQSLAKNIKADETLGWDLSADPCSWKKVVCQNGRVTGLDFQSKGVTGSLPPDFGKLSGLQNLSIQKNKLTGPLPSFSGMSDLRSAYVNENQFSSIPEGFFKGLTNLQVLALDENIFPPWTIPDDLKDSSSLANFSATNASVTGPIPNFFGDFPNLITLSLAFNNLTGSIPASFGNNTSIRILWLNNQKGNRLSGSLDVISGMQSLTQLWLHFNSFTGPIPDLSGLTFLKDIRLDGNKLTGLVPKSLSDLPRLTNVTLSGNALQGPYPVFAKGVVTDVSQNDFCLDSPGDCDQRVNALLAFAKDLGYPYAFASDWKGNNPCSSWLYVSCDSKDEISVLNMKNLNLTGTLSPVLANFTHLTQVDLSNNNIYGTIPPQLTTLTQLSKLDLSNNNLQGTIPKFKRGVLIVDGNKNIGKNVPPQSPQSPQSPGSPSNPVSPASPASESPGKSDSDNKKGSSSNIGAIVGGVIGGILGLGLIGFLCFCLRRRTRKSGRVQSPNVSVADPHHSANSDARQLLKISIDGRQSNSITNNDSVSSHAGRQSDIHVVEAGNMIISIEVLRNVTNNFSDENVLGRGGFGVVYKGELHDGTKIAVKRMEAGIVTGKGLNEFQAEIAVLTKVRHRHLVALLGYCVEGNERLLVYEYMPQGPLSHHLFEWQKRDLNPMDWTRRLTIALDVARGVEYLHSLAQKSFIHRDLKPSNILLDDDLRAKVSDFGLVRLAPEGKYSVETRLAGTFGYLAPEYAVTGRVTTKADVFSYGVVLMELITGRKALDENEPEESMHLVTWFRRMHVNKENFRTAIDKTLEQTEETYKSICTVAELAGYCTAREPYQRPDMGHAVNVLSSLVEQWKPAKMDEEDMYGIDFDMSLPQALKKWQSLEDSNAGTTFGSSDNTQTSIPTRPSGFAESFTSADGR